MTLFYFWGISYVSFIYNFVNIGPLWFFLISLCKGLSILIFSRNQPLVFLIFSAVFLFLVYFCYNHYYSLPSANFELTSFFFFSPLRYKVRLWFFFFFRSFYLLQICTYSYKYLLFMHPMGFDFFIFISLKICFNFLFNLMFDP